MRYVKLPVEVEAVFWDGTPESKEAVAALLIGSEGDWTLMHLFNTLRVDTVDGNDVLVPLGAYVVLDSKNWAYPCDAEIFEAGHRLV